MKHLELKPRILDLYIIKKFISTFFVALILIIGIVIIFDISEKIDDFVSKEAPLKAIIFAELEQGSRPIREQVPEA